MVSNRVATGVRQVAQHADDLEQSIGFYRDVLGGELLGKFDPPGLAIVRFGTVRVLLEGAAPPATLYFDVADIEAAHAEMTEEGVQFEATPHLVHRDDSGLFGPPGGEEWMAFLRDPAGALVALVEWRDSRTG